MGGLSDGIGLGTRPARGSSTVPNPPRPPCAPSPRPPPPPGAELRAGPVDHRAGHLLRERRLPAARDRPGHRRLLVRDHRLQRRLGAGRVDRVEQAGADPGQEPLQDRRRAHRAHRLQLREVRRLRLDNDETHCPGTCQPTPTCSLGVSCADVYWATLNDGKNGGGKWELDPVTGAWPSGTPTGPTGNPLLRGRLQVELTDFADPTAVYVAEGQYLARTTTRRAWRATTTAGARCRSTAATR